MRTRLILAAILALAAGLRVWGLSFGLPHTLARPDEEAVFAISLNVFQRHYDPGFFDWPSLYMYVVSLGDILFFNLGRLFGRFDYEYEFLRAVAADPAPLYLIARSVSVACGVWTVWLIARIGDTLCGPRVGLWAAALLAVAPLHVRDSHFGVPDTTAAALIAASLLFVVRYWREPSTRHALLAGVCGGLAASAKYNAGLVVLIAIAAVLQRPVSGADPGVRLPEGGGDPGVLSAGTARWRSRVVLAAAVGLIALTAFVAGTPYAVLNWRGFIEGLQRISAHLAAGHAAFAGWAWGVHLRSSLYYGLRAPLLAAALVGLALLLRQGGSARLVALFPIAYFFVIGAGQTAFARYILPAVPVLCLAAAVATVAAGDWLRARLAGRWAAAAASALSLLVVAPSLWTALSSDRVLARPDTRVVAADWIAREYPAGASLYQAGSVYGQVQMRAADAEVRYPSVTLDAQGGPLEMAAAMTPRLLIVQQHPLAYSRAPDALAATMERGAFVRRAEFTAMPSFERAVFDMDDAFYVPLSGFVAGARPGPTLVVYEAAR